MMHNKDNTNIEIIRKNYENLPDDKKGNKNCVLLITGSFNPIHRFHIKNLRYVKEYLEKHETSPMNVLAAYISPTHDDYVRPKLGDAEWIFGDQRCKLCEGAIKEEGPTVADFIAVSRGEMEYKRGFVDFNEVSVRLAEFLNSTLYDHEKLFEHPIKVVYVCGLDHFNKCPYVAQLAREENMACAVIHRLGAREERIKTLKEPSSNVYYITFKDEGEPLVDVSSTAIRRYYRSGNNLDPDQSSYSCVADYYKEKFSENQ